MMIKRSPVDSSNVKSVGYDADSKTLAIEFADGSIYHYDDVKQDVYNELQGSKSIGKFIHANIKGVYKHAKQDKDKD